ncbi:MAG: hypothetical protein KA419_11980 [Acidobacteria bacterium]|nr:hypothetical protein [Acidobacteriota bacterium]
MPAFAWVYLVAFGLAAGSTALMIPVARRLGFVAKPREDRWHRKPTALLGGIGIFVGFAAAVVPFIPPSRENLLVIGGAGAAFLFGLLDDIRETRPRTKLLFQLALATAAALLGLRLNFVANPWVAVPLTILWFTAIINAFNIIDNMDGLSSGVAFVSGLCILVYAFQHGLGGVAILAAAVSGACLGFLLFNFNPAKIFMGDCGSLCIGYILAAVTIMSTWRGAANLLFAIFMPVCFLAVPIFDTVLVSFQRRLHGRPISRGGRDHTSHRLVILGLSERKTVLFLMGISLSFGLSAAFFTRFGLLGTLSLFGMLAISMLIFGLFLSEVRIYGTAALSQRRGGIGAVLRFVRDHALVLLMDAVLLGIAYVLSYLLRFDGTVADFNLARMKESFAVVVLVKIAVFLLAGFYRHDWRRAGIRELFLLVRWNVVASLASVLAILALFRFEGYSRALFFVDFTLSLVLVGTARFSLWILREYFRHGVEPRSGDPVLIYGADDAGELLLRTLRLRGDLRMSAVGFLDPGPEREHALILGVPVLGSLDTLGHVAASTGARRVLVPERPDESEVLEELSRAAGPHGVSVQVVRLVLEPSTGGTPEEARADGSGT